jgi:hypothetical protein
LVVPKDSEPGTAPVYWLSDEPAGAELWVRLHQAHISGEHHWLEVVGDDSREMAGSMQLDPRSDFPEWFWWD